MKWQLAACLPLLVVVDLLHLSNAQNNSGPIARVLLFSATRGFRHDAIPTAIRNLKARGPTNSPRIQFDDTEDASKFNETNLRIYDAVVFLLTSGEVLNSAGLQALQRYLDLGGNWAGVHSATDTLYDSEFYRKAVGAHFDSHPPVQRGVVLVLDKEHPSTKGLPERWAISDEFYNFRSDPRSLGAKVILSIDESSYRENNTRRFDHGAPHPIAWYQAQVAAAASADVAGRSWYTSLGHLRSVWEPFLDHIMGGISWVLASNKTLAFNPAGQVGNRPT